MVSQRLISSGTYIVVYAMLNLLGTSSGNPVSVDLVDTRIQAGKKLEVECKHSNSSLQSFLRWLNPNMINVENMNSTRITNINGTLTITKSEVGDSGSYTCLHNEGGLVFNTTSKIAVFEVPDYFSTAMIIIGVNAALIFVFMGCFVYRVMKRKKGGGKPKSYRRPTL